jgi:hypothetical protein
VFSTQRKLQVIVLDFGGFGDWQNPEEKESDDDLTEQHREHRPRNFGTHYFEILKKFSDALKSIIIHSGSS